MNSRILRVYADTTIFGGVFDPEYEKPSQAFFQEVQTGKFRLVTSAVVQNEIETGPPQLREFYEKTIGLAGIVNLSEDVWKLHQAYLDAESISPELILDALHVAMATVSECFALVSWDFKNLVHYKKIRFYNAINLLEGYSQISIYSPLEVISYDHK